MSIMIEFDNEEVLFPIHSNFTKHEEAKRLAQAMNKRSYKFIYINVEGISPQFLLEENKQD